MNQPQPFSDHKIRQTIEAIKSDGQNITPWAVQSRLGGGDFLRIQQIIEQFFPEENTQVSNTPAASNPMHFNAQPKRSRANTHSQPQPSANQPFTNTDDKKDILDKQIPSDIEASMYQMQTALGQMASRLWNEAATNAEDQVRGKLFSAEQAHKEAEAAKNEALRSNQKMQSTIERLNDEAAQLNSEYQQTLKTLATEQQTLQNTITERDQLKKSVEHLETENQSLEQQAFNSNIEAAKASGLADIIKEQLALAKQTEKQLQKALDRSEKKVDELNRELHSSSQSLRDELRDRQIPMHPPKRSKPTLEQINQQYPPQELPKPSAADVTPIKPAEEVAPQAPQQIPPAAAAAQPSTQGKVIQDLGHSLALNRAQKAAQPKTRTLTDKLFDRKKHPFKNKKK